MSSVMSLQEENRVLQGELARLEDLLAHSRADRDELAIKYGAISERVMTNHKLINHHWCGPNRSRTENCSQAQEKCVHCLCKKTLSQKLSSCSGCTEVGGNAVAPFPFPISLFSGASFV